MSDQAAELTAFRKRTLAQGEAFARAFADPETTARKLAEWVRENFPAKIAEAYWISASGDRDKGIDVEILERPVGAIRFRLGALLGARSGGVAVTTPVLSEGRVTVAVGVGAVAPYADLGRVSAVGVVSVRF